MNENDKPTLDDLVDHWPGPSGDKARAELQALRASAREAAGLRAWLQFIATVCHEHMAACFRGKEEGFDKGVRGDGWGRVKNYAREAMDGEPAPPASALRDATKKVCQGEDGERHGG